MNDNSEHLVSPHRKRGAVVAIDHNRWRHHVLTSLELLTAEALLGRTCYYVNTCDDSRFRFGSMYPTRALNFWAKNLSTSGTLSLINKNFEVDLRVISLPNLNKKEYHESERNNVVSRIIEATDESQIRAITYRNAQLGYAIVSSAHERLKSSSEKLMQRKSLLLQEAKVFMNTFDSVHLLCQDEEIETVIVFNGRFSYERATWEAAKFCNKEVLIHEASVEGKYVSNEYGVHSIAGYASDAIFEWNRANPIDRYQIATQWFQNRKVQFPSRSRLTARQTSCPSSSTQLLDELLSSNYENKPIACLFNTSDREFFSISPEWEIKSSESQLERFSWISKELVAQGFLVVLRLHPNMQGESKRTIRAWKNLANLGVVVFGPESPIDSYSLIDNCSIVVTAGSTTGVEASARQRFSILVGHAIYQDLNCVMTCDSIESFRKALVLKDDIRLTAFLYENSLKFGYYESVRWLERSLIQPEIDSSLSNLHKPNLTVELIGKLFRLSSRLKDQALFFRYRFKKKQ